MDKKRKAALAKKAVENGWSFKQYKAMLRLHELDEKKKKNRPGK